MSLGRLLTSGKSLVGLNDGECRYQMRAKNLLPKFGSDKNPFDGKRVVQPAAPAPAETLQSEFSRRLPAPAAKVGKSNAPVAAAETKPAAAPAKSEPAAKKESMFTKVAALLRKLNPLNGRKAKSSSSIPRFDKAPVQTELSLDRIKVVRNDLSEADVEIVPVKIAVQSKPEPVEVKVAPAQPTTPELIKT